MNIGLHLGRKVDNPVHWIIYPTEGESMQGTASGKELAISYLRKVKTDCPEFKCFYLGEDYSMIREEIL